MLKTEKRALISEYFFYFVLLLWFGVEVLTNTTLERIIFWNKADVNDAVAIVVLVLLVVQIVVFQKYNIRELIIIMVISLPVFLAAMNSGHNMMLSTWLFIIASKYINFDRIVFLSYIMLWGMCAIVLYLFLIGNISEVIFYRGTILRHSLGFAHPNWLGVRVFQLVLAHVYLRRKRLSLLDFSFMAAATAFVFYVPNCLTAFYALFILGVLLVLYRLSEYIEGGKEKVSCLLIVGALVVNVFSVVISSMDIRRNTWLYQFDHIMSRRFSWCHKALSYFGINLWGQDIKLYGRIMNSRVKLFYIDTAYVAILLRYGILVYIFFSVLYIIAMICLFKQKRYFLLLILFVYATYGVMENSFFSMTQNIFLLALGLPLFSSQENKYAEDLIKKPVVRITFG